MWATCRSERNWCWACARSILGEHELNGWLRLANITPPLEYGANPKRPRQRVRPWQMNQLRWFTEWKGCFGGCRGRGTCVVGVCVCERGASGLDCAEGPPRPYDEVMCCAPQLVGDTPHREFSYAQSPSPNVHCF